MSKRDYYRILNVSKTASIDQIKVSFRKLAKENHPDLCTLDKKTAEENFKNLALAYQTLSKPASKAEYDESIGNRQNGHSRHMGQNWSGIRSNQVRNPATGAQVNRNQYNVDEWNAWHYGQDDEEDGQRGWGKSFIRHRNRWVDPTNKHQSYYRRKYERYRHEEKSGVKWSADAAYQSGGFHGASTSSSNTGNHNGSSGNRNDDTSCNTHKSPNGSTNVSYAYADQKSQHIRTAADNLRRRREQRVATVDSAHNSSSTGTGTGSIHDSCSIS
mmetsp:Transcript_27013/g.45557  ORF Transcript_27013/g.45557 Transcript_27013/m.45557 type:complete len:272 (-) Transcript_27013:123-938(-)